MTMQYYWSKKNESEAALLWASLRDRRGLNIIVGKQGTGKSTMCQELVRKYAGGDTGMRPVFLPGGFYNNRKDLISSLNILFHGQFPPPNCTEREVMNELRHTLKMSSLEHPAPFVLFIDDAGRIQGDSWSVIHELLLDEVDGNKNLQIVILARPNQLKSLHEHANVVTRIQTVVQIFPLNFYETHIFARQHLSHVASKRVQQFPLIAKLLLYSLSKGNPAVICEICDALVSRDSKDSPRPILSWLLQHLVLRGKADH